MDVGLRSLEALLDESNLSAVFRTYAIACANKIKFQMIHIPDNVDTGHDSLEFDNKIMINLSELGYKRAISNPISWEPMPPTGEDLDPICSGL